MFKKLKELLYTEYTDIDDILERYKNEIENIKHYVGSETLFEAQYLPIIRNYAEYVYTLPASEHQQSDEEYGLFAHGLDATITALQLYDEKGISPEDQQKFKIKKLTIEEKKRWKLAIFSAAIMQNIGKIMASMIVSIEVHKQKDGSTHKYWMPMYEPLLHFLDRENNYDYKVKWIQSKAVNHETFNSMFMSAIIPENVYHNLGTEKLLMIMDAIRPAKKEKKNILLYYFNPEDPRACKHPVIIHDK